MSKLDFSINLSAPYEQLITLFTDYENYPNYLPDQLKSVKILEQNKNEIITNEEIFFSNYIKKPFQQKTIHKIISSNTFESEIISGPAKGTTIKVLFEKIESGTKVSINMNLKLSLKAIILLPLIKKWYKRILTVVLYKMNTIALEEPS